MWGRWQVRLSQDLAAAQSRYLSLILRTHWIRTLLITAYGAVLLAWAIVVLS